MLTKKNWDKAYDILKNNSDIDSTSSGGIYRFTYLTYDGLKELVGNKYIPLCERQNYSPTVGQWIDLFEKYKLKDRIYFLGYIVEISRSDRRVSIDGIEASVGSKFSAEEWKAICKITSSADEFHTDPLLAWWD